MPWDGYLAKKNTTLENREHDLLRLLSTQNIDSDKLREAADKIMKGHLRILQAKLDVAQLNLSFLGCPIKADKNKSDIHKRENYLRQIEKVVGIHSPANCGNAVSMTVSYVTKQN